VTDPIKRVARASQAKRRPEQEYRAALRAAREAGYSFAEIARAAGITREAARKIGR
jgi:ribosomal protein L13E